MLKFIAESTLLIAIFVAGTYGTVRLWDYLTD